MDKLNNKFDIQNWLNNVHVKNYTIHDDLSVTLEETLDLSNKNLSFIPIDFKEIKGKNVNLSKNYLVRLPLLPKELDNLNVSENRLEDLMGCPEIIHFYFNCESNNLLSLKGGPKTVGRQYFAQDNMIQNYQSSPEYVGMQLFIDLDDFPVLKDLQKTQFESIIFKTHLLIPEWQNFFDSNSYQIKHKDFFITIEQEFLKERLNLTETANLNHLDNKIEKKKRKI